jgi:hypothetical protein
VKYNGNPDGLHCYYNFKCLHPALGFDAFNSILSNIGYIALGFGNIIATT